MGQTRTSASLNGMSALPSTADVVGPLQQLDRDPIGSSMTFSESGRRFPQNPYFQGVTGGTLSVAGGTSTVLKSAGLTISRYSMSGE